MRVSVRVRGIFRVLASGVLLVVAPVAGAQLVAGGAEHSYSPLSPVPRVDFNQALPAEPWVFPSLREKHLLGAKLYLVVPGFRGIQPPAPGRPKLWQGKPPARAFVESGQLTLIATAPLTGNPSSAALSLGDASASSQIRQEYAPITAGGRFRWVLKSTFDLKSLSIGIASSAISTAWNKPPEWGPGWEGFGKRLGTRQATVLTSSVIEAGVGALWGEDPRYIHSGKKGFWPRASHAVRMAFLSYRRDGSVGPAYSRFTGVAASRFIAATWRPPSDDDWEDTAARIGLAYVSRAFTNLWSEFWPGRAQRERRTPLTRAR